MPLKIHPDIASLSPYVPGKPIEELQRELGLARVIKLASNENPSGSSPKALAALSGEIATLHRYPDGGAFRLREALADRWKVTPDQVILGNGSDEILGLLARTFLVPGDEAVMADQTFVIYKMEVTAAHGTPVIVPLTQWRHNLQAMADAITDRTRLLFLCNPNNPTGTMVSAGEVESLLSRVPDHVVVVFDEAYFEYVRSQQFPDSIAYVKQGRNVIVLRTFSKVYGLAGLRIGYGVATAEIRISVLVVASAVVAIESIAFLLRFSTSSPFSLLIHGSMGISKAGGFMSAVTTLFIGSLSWSVVYGVLLWYDVHVTKGRHRRPKPWSISALRSTGRMGTNIPPTSVTSLNMGTTSSTTTGVETGNGPKQKGQPQND